MSKKGDRIAVIDAETDPFDGENLVYPFVWGFFDGHKYIKFDGPECTYNLVEYIKNYNGIIYAHNGGKFDYHFLLPYIDLQENLLIINGRLASCKLGKATLHDSYCILPVPLAVMEKDEFDYSLMTKEKRIIPENKEKIETYLKHDCIYLWKKIRRFIDEYGYSITLAGAAFKQFKNIYPDLKIPTSNKEYFHKFSEFYYGGRVTPFKTGIFEGNFKVYDINSAYPYAMLQQHPIGTKYFETSSPNKEQIKKSLIQCRGYSKGALPVRSKAGLTFPTGKNEFFITGWEFLTAIETKTLTNYKILNAFVFQETTSFEKYVDKFYTLKENCGNNGDKIGRLFAKLFLNTLYGKFASNPENYEEFYLDYYGNKPIDDYQPGMVLHDYQLFSRELPENKQHFYNVVTAASITGFVRAYLWKAILQCNDVLYCDTDSIICRDAPTLSVGTAIGQWEIEAELTKIVIAGKKMYAGWKKDGGTKSASKGVRLSPDQILQVANGKTVKYKSLAPTYSLKTEVKFLERNIKRTA